MGPAAVFLAKIFFVRRTRFHLSTFGLQKWSRGSIQLQKKTERATLGFGKRCVGKPFGFLSQKIRRGELKGRSASQGPLAILASLHVRRISGNRSANICSKNRSKKVAKCYVNRDLRAEAPWRSCERPASAISGKRQVYIIPQVYIIKIIVNLIEQMFGSWHSPTNR